jgi:hypothetical protein
MSITTQRKVKMQNWISTKDKLPELVDVLFGIRISTKILVINEADILCAYLQYCVDDGTYRWYSTCSNRWSLEKVTHWIELPEVPKV